MKATERYINLSERQIKDTQNQAQSFLSVKQVCDLLNQQSARIKELKSQLRVNNSQLASSELKYNGLKEEYKKQEDLLNSYLKNCSELNFENQQLKKQLEVQKSKSELVAENEALKDTIAVVLAQKRNTLKNNDELRKEITQLKQSQKQLAISEFEKY